MKYKQQRKTIIIRNKRIMKHLLKILTIVFTIASMTACSSTEDTIDKISQDSRTITASMTGIEKPGLASVDNNTGGTRTSISNPKVLTTQWQEGDVVKVTYTFKDKNGTVIDATDCPDGTVQTFTATNVGVDGTATWLASPVEMRLPQAISSISATFFYAHDHSNDIKQSITDTTTTYTEQTGLETMTAKVNEFTLTDITNDAITVAPSSWTRAQAAVAISDVTPGQTVKITSTATDATPITFTSPTKTTWNKGVDVSPNLLATYICYITTGENSQTVKMEGTTGRTFSFTANPGNIYIVSGNLLFSGADDPQGNQSATVIGDFLFSDGTWGSLSQNSSKTPIAIIFMNTVSTTDKTSGYTHGYAMALKDASTSSQWSTLNKLITGNATFDTTLLRDNYDGLTNTQQILSAGSSSECPAAYAAKNYNNGEHPVGTSQWYLPSYWQWYQLLVNLGCASTSPTIGTSNVQWNNVSCATNISKRISLAGSGNYNSFAETQYWSSSEYYSGYAYRANISSSGADLDYSSKTTTYYVRPVIAF